MLRDLDALSDADVRAAYEQAMMWFVGTGVGIDADRRITPGNDVLTVAELVDDPPSRVGALAVHTPDLRHASGPDEPPPLPVEVTLSFVAALADPVKAIMALTGRIGCDVFT